MPTIITISGFGDPDVNGFYELDGQHDGQDFYIKDTGDYIITYRTRNGAYSNDPAYWIEEVVSENGAVPIFVPKYSASEDDIDSAEWKATSNVDDDTVGVLGSSTYMYLPCTTCGCENNTDPRMSVTVSWQNDPFGTKIESHDIFGCTFFNGESKEVCASSYSFVNSGLDFDAEVWENAGAGGRLAVSNDHVGTAKVQKRGRVVVHGDDIFGTSGFVKAGGAVQNFPYVVENTSITSGGLQNFFDSFEDSGTLRYTAAHNNRVIPLGFTVKPFALSGLINSDQFGSLTTTGGLTITWGRLSPSNSIDTGIDYWVATAP